MSRGRKRKKLINKKFIIFLAFTALSATLSSYFTPHFNLNFFTIESLLRDKNNYIFWTNPGNLGDMLINYAEIQLLNRLDINFTVNMSTIPEKPFNLILGGGGRFIDIYQCGRDTYEILKSPNLKSCTMLSASIRNCKELLSLFDQRFTILLREAESYEYCIRNNRKARFIRANDMALYLNMTKLQFTTITNISSKCNFDLTDSDYIENKFRAYIMAIQRFKRMSYRTTYSMNNKTIRFYFRSDGEKKVSYNITNHYNSYDLPLLTCVDHTHIENVGLWCRIFMAIVDSSDIIVTDRLHVGIAGLMLNKEVYYLDNTYGKISGVYETTLGQFNNIHMLSNESMQSLFPLDFLTEKEDTIPQKLLPFLNMTFNMYTSELCRFSNPSEF